MQQRYSLSKMKLKINTKDKAGLCGVCRHGHVYYQGNRMTIRCNYGSEFVVTKKVDECSRFIDSLVPSLGQMEEIAWVLKTHETRQVGFDTSKMVREVEFEPPEKEDKYHKMPWD